MASVQSENGIQFSILYTCTHTHTHTHTHTNGTRVCPAVYQINSTCRRNHLACPLSVCLHTIMWPPPPPYVLRSIFPSFTPQSCWGRAPIGRNPGSCPPFERVHAGITPSKLVDFFKCNLWHEAIKKEHKDKGGNVKHETTQMKTRQEMSNYSYFYIFIFLFTFLEWQEHA